MGNRVEALVTELARPAVAAIGLELVDVQFVKEGGRCYLRLYVDKEGGVNLDDCAAASRAVDALLDETDPISTPYSLEVSSPGIERPLKQDADFTRFAGQLVRVTTFAPIDGRRSFVGELLGMADGLVQIRVKGEGKAPVQEMAIPRAQVAKANLHVEF